HGRELVQGAGDLCGRRQLVHRPERMQGQRRPEDVGRRLQGEGRQGRRGPEAVVSGRPAGPCGPPAVLASRATMAITLPYLGHGVGLRPTHYPAILDEGKRADWFEVISENYMLRGGRPLHVLERIRAERPIVLHGV